MRRPSFLLLPLTLLACGDAASAPVEPAPVAPPVAPLEPAPSSNAVLLLPPTSHLARVSLAIRGVRPSYDDLALVERDPSQISMLVDRYLATPEFGRTVRELYNDVLLMRTEHQKLLAPPNDSLSAAEFTATQAFSLGEEPLRLIEDIVMSDQPFTQIVKADYTLANAFVARVWGFPHAGDPDAWQRVRWRDGRGAAGVLGTDGLYFRWESAGDNFSRGRANVISRALLCHDFLKSEIDIDTSVDLSNPDVVADAVVKNGSCAACHQALDPIASHLMEVREFFPQTNLARDRLAYPIVNFDGTKYDRWSRTNKRAPSYFGMPSQGPHLPALGQRIAEDPRFARCAVQRFAAYLTRVPLESVATSWAAALQDEFVRGNYNVKALVKRIVLSDAFRVSHATGAVEAEQLAGMHRLRPDQMTRVFGDLTGYTYRFEGSYKFRGYNYGEADLLESSMLGYRVLAGGIDGYYATSPVPTMTSTALLAARTVARAAAQAAVDDGAQGHPTLFARRPVTTTDEAGVREQLAYLHARIFSEWVEPSSPAVDASYALFKDAYALRNDARRAWAVTLSAMMSDPRSLYY